MVFGLMHNSRPNFLVRQAAANEFHQSNSRPVVPDDVAFVLQRIEIGAKGEAAGEVDRKALQVARYVDQCSVAGRRKDAINARIEKCIPQCGCG